MRRGNQSTIFQQLSESSNSDREVAMEEQTARLLIVDDEQDTCSNLSDIFTDLGFQVDVAYDGPAALALVDRRACLGRRNQDLARAESYIHRRRLRRLNRNGRGMKVADASSQ